MITDKDLKEALMRVTGLSIFRDPIALSFQEIKQLVESILNEHSIICVNMKDIPTGVSIEELSRRLSPRKAVVLDRHPIILQDFLFTLNQDEDCRVTITDFNQCFGHTLFEGWKSTLRNGGTTGFNYPHDYSYYKDWYVQDFTSIQGGIEICITKELED